ncbi:MAG: NADP-dependent phosphogluconate dehydrogenase [Pseudonocardiaceae bacterium]
MTDTAPRIAVTGLATMGRNLARNLARHGNPVAVHNRTASRTRALIDEFGGEGSFVATETLPELVGALQRPRQVIVMVQAGASTDAVIDELAGLLDRGDVIIDGGNAHFADTRRRDAALCERGLHFLGTGISGGEEGALLGPSIMPGGSQQAYAELGPVLESIAAQVDGEPCCTHIGPDGSGHFVKMVHNGIEYADMQFLAEAYDLLRHGAGMPADGIAEVFRRWSAGPLAGYLVEITAEVLSQVDAETGASFVDVVADAAEQKGTGRWTVQQALELGTPVSAIAEAVFARSLSGGVEARAAARDLPGPTAPPSLGEGIVDDLEQALLAAKTVAYSQGFAMIRAASAEYGWGIRPAPIAAIWRGGCIIRAALLDRIRAAYTDDPSLVSLLGHTEFSDALATAQGPWRRVVARAAEAGVPAPGLSSSLAHYDGLRAQRLPAALVQGLRDYFGAHTYRRTDREGTFHTRWGTDRRETSV